MTWGFISKYYKFEFLTPIAGDELNNSGPLWAGDAVRIAEYLSHLLPHFDLITKVTIYSWIYW